MSNSFKAALFTALFTFIFTAATALIGFLSAVTEFLNGNDPTLSDDLGLLGKVVLSAVVAFGSGLLNWLVRALQAKGFLGGSVPKYDKS